MTGPALSVVVVSHEMARELPRTLLSLSPGHQAGMAGTPYEVIVVDNGSRAPPRAEAFAALGLDLTVLHAPAPGVSPVPAINLGLAAARAPLIGAWIDGARLASPGLLAACRDAARLHARPVIATANHHLGPEIQPLSCRQGYDQAREDALLASIGWPRDGYALFGISTPVDRQGPAGPMLESNALFLPRVLWEETGGYDPAFTARGGGFANPDMLARACALPGIQLIRILGEASFHQFHGGTTSSDPDGLARRLMEFGRDYVRLRGRPVSAVRRRGWLFDARRGEVLAEAPA